MLAAHGDCFAADGSSWQGKLNVVRSRRPGPLQHKACSWLTLQCHIMLDGVLQRSIANVRVLPASCGLSGQPLPKLQNIMRAAIQQLARYS